MQVYNYFLIKTQCALCFYKWWLFVQRWEGGRDGLTSGSRRPWPALPHSRLLLARLKTRKQLSWPSPTYRLLPEPLWQFGLQLPWIEARDSNRTQRNGAGASWWGRCQGQKDDRTIGKTQALHVAQAPIFISFPAPVVDFPLKNRMLGRTGESGSSPPHAPGLLSAPVRLQLLCPASHTTSCLSPTRLCPAFSPHSHSHPASLPRAPLQLPHYY